MIRWNLNKKNSNWFANKIEIAITFIFSILGTLALVITIIGLLNTINWGPFIGAYGTVAQAEAISFDTDDSIDNTYDDNFNQRLILHICISVVLFITYTLLKKYLKRSVLVKIIMPSNSDNSNESNILLELNSGFDSVLLYVCTIKGQLHQFSLSSNVAIETTVLTNHWFYSILKINWNNNNFRLFQNNELCQLPTYVYVPLHKMRIANKIKGNPSTVRILISNTIYYDCSRNHIQAL